MALESTPGVMFDPTINSLSDNYYTRSLDMNALLTCTRGGTLLPSATANTNGTAQVMTPPAPHATCRPWSMHGTISGLGPAETMQITLTATNEDATTKTSVVSGLRNGAFAYTPAQMAALFTSGKKITQIAAAVQSTGASSAGQCLFYLVGLNGG